MRIVHKELMLLWNNCYELGPPGLRLLTNQNYTELRVFVVYAVLHSFITMLYELSLRQQKFCNPQACVKVIFNFVDVFPSTFLQPVNCSKNSIYTELSYETWSLHVFQTIEIFSILFSYSLSDYLLLQSSVRNALWRPKLKKITTEIVNYAISKQ